MANISLKKLFEAEDFKAKSKETGKLVHFKSKDAYQAALKAGTHEDPKAKKGEQPKAAAKPNDMFGGDYVKDRSGDLPVGDLQYRLQKNKQASKSDASVDGQSDDELYDALYDMGYDFGEFGSDDFDEQGFADTAIDLGYRYDDKNKVWNHRDDDIEESSTKLTSMIKR
jgi:hypothetical protein